MEQIVDLRDRFASPEVYAVFRDCMFRPTPETFALKAHRWMEDPDVLLLGSLRQQHIAGVLALRRKGGNARIEGIAVAAGLRRQGVARELIASTMAQFDLHAITAETDDDAVRFYAHAGFEVEAFDRCFDGVWRAPLSLHASALTDFAEN